MCKVLSFAAGLWSRRCRGYIQIPSSWQLAGPWEVRLHPHGCVWPVTSPIPSAFWPALRWPSMHDCSGSDASHSPCVLRLPAANILVRYLGEEGEKTPIRAAISMCNPFNLVSILPHALTPRFDPPTPAL